jgi:hypothetical protein
MQSGMKPKLLAIAMGLALGICATGCANQSGAKSQSSSDDQYEYQYVTGSYIPQKVQKNGPVTNGKDDLRLIDRSEVDRSGGADVDQTLRQLGVTR